MRVTNGIPLGWTLLLPVCTVNCVLKPKACSSYGPVEVRDSHLSGYQFGFPNQLENCSTAVGLIVDDPDGLWKLLTGSESQYYQTGPAFPNASTTTDSQNQMYTKECANGCLFNLRTDPTERVDLAKVYPGKVLHLNVRLAAYEATAFNPHRGTDNGAACKAAATVWDGFWGPWLQ
jgi:hypothetical protein